MNRLTQIIILTRVPLRSKFSKGKTRKGNPFNGRAAVKWFKF